MAIGKATRKDRDEGAWGPPAIGGTGRNSQVLLATEHLVINAAHATHAVAVTVKLCEKRMKRSGEGKKETKADPKRGRTNMVS